MKQTYLGTEWSLLDWIAAVMCTTWALAMLVTAVIFIARGLR